MWTVMRSSSGWVCFGTNLCKAEDKTPELADGGRCGRAAEALRAAGAAVEGAGAPIITEASSKPAREVDDVDGDGFSYHLLRGVFLPDV